MQFVGFGVVVLSLNNSIGRFHAHSHFVVETSIDGMQHPSVKRK
jgi:hypothetical protein